MTVWSYMPCESKLSSMPFTMPKLNATMKNNVKQVKDNLINYLLNHIEAKEEAGSNSIYSSILLLSAPFTQCLEM